MCYFNQGCPGREEVRFPGSQEMVKPDATPNFVIGVISLARPTPPSPPWRTSDTKTQTGKQSIANSKWASTFSARNRGDHHQTGEIASRSRPSALRATLEFVGVLPKSPDPFLGRSLRDPKVPALKRRVAPDPDGKCHLRSPKHSVFQKGFLKGGLAADLVIRQRLGIAMDLMSHDDVSLGSGVQPIPKTIPQKMKCHDGYHQGQPGEHH